MFNFAGGQRETIDVPWVSGAFPFNTADKKNSHLNGEPIVVIRRLSVRIIRSYRLFYQAKTSARLKNESTVFETRKA